MLNYGYNYSNQYFTPNNYNQAYQQYQNYPSFFQQPYQQSYQQPYQGYYQQPIWPSPSPIPGPYYPPYQNTLNGTSAPDYINNSYYQNINGAEGDDYINSGSSSYSYNNKNISGGAGNDVIMGGGNTYSYYPYYYQNTPPQTAQPENNFYGNEGDDKIYLGAGRANGYGGAGNDNLFVSNERSWYTKSNTYVSGGDGIDNLWLEGKQEDYQYVDQNAANAYSQNVDPYTILQNLKTGNMITISNDVENINYGYNRPGANYPYYW